MSQQPHEGARAAQGNIVSTADSDYQADAGWFHMFRSMIDSGDLANMPGADVKVYLVIKAHVNHATGKSFPGTEKIAQKAGLSGRQVIRCLKSLEAQNYIIKTRVGRRNEYRLREKVEIQDESGRPAAVATWDYLPRTVKEAVADLRNVLLTGQLGDAKVVHIDRLQVNVTHVHDQGVNFNVQQMAADLEKLPPGLRERLLNTIEKARTSPKSK